MDREKVIKVYRLLSEVDFPVPFAQFFDVESEKLLDDKIEVLQALKDGKTIGEIPKFYDILELMPKNGDLWD